MMASQTSHWISKKCRQSSTQRSLGLVNSGTGIRQPPESTTIPLHPLFMGPPERGRLCWGESRPPLAGETWGLPLTPEGGWRGAKASLTFQA